MMVSRLYADFVAHLPPFNFFENGFSEIPGWKKMRKGGNSGGEWAERRQRLYKAFRSSEASQRRAVKAIRQRFHGIKRILRLYPSRVYDIKHYVRHLIAEARRCWYFRELDAKHKEEAEQILREVEEVARRRFQQRALDGFLR